MTNRRSGLVNKNGNSSPNQVQFEDSKGRHFVSYGTYIARVSRDGKVDLTGYWDYSNTTLRWLKFFLGTDETAMEIRKKLKTGEYGSFEEESKKGTK